jgi:hypothetical protein
LSRPGRAVGREPGELPVSGLAGQLRRSDVGNGLGVQGLLAMGACRLHHQSMRIVEDGGEHTRRGAVVGPLVRLVQPLGGCDKGMKGPAAAHRR